LISNGSTRAEAAAASLASADDLTVTAVTDGDAAAERADDVDCVVGVHGAGVDAVAALERLRDRRPQMPFVLVAEGAAVASRAVAADVSEFVPRSADDEHLLERVHAAIEAARPLRADGTASMPMEALDVREELRLKERVIDEAPVGITIADAEGPDTPMVYVNDAFERLTGYDKDRSIGRNCRFLQGDDSDPAAIGAMREAVDEGESVSVELRNYRKDGEPFWNRVDIAPVHGDDGSVTHFVGFQTDITERKEAEMKVKHERQKLEHLLFRIDGLVQEVTHELVQAESRADIEQGLCECVAGVDTYEFAWVGAPDRPRNALAATAWDGAWEPTEDELETDLSEAGWPEPAREAYRSGTVETVDDPAVLAAVADRSSWTEGEDLRGIAAVPLVYGETTYGVLTLYTTEAEALTSHETVVLEALGRATGTAINALERGRILATDSVTEIAVEMRDDDLFFVGLSEQTGGTLEYEGSVYRDDGTVLMFFRSDLDVGSVLEASSAYPQVASADPIHEHDDETLFQFELTEASITATLAERGAKICSIAATDGVATVEVELPGDAEVRTIGELLEERYPDSDIVAQRERERPPSTRQDFTDDVEDRLTERQLTALQKAHVSGFFEWNRPVTGDALAESMDIGRSTFHQHLRAAERKLVEAFLEQ